MGITMLVYSNSTFLLPYFNREIEVRLGYGLYSNNNSLAVVLLCREADIDVDLLDDDGYNYDESVFDEVLGTITVNLEKSVHLPAGEQFVDINNYPQIARWLIENGLAIPSGRMESSGRILYPAYRFQVPPDFAERLKTGNKE